MELSSCDFILVLDPDGRGGQVVGQDGKAGVVRANVQLAAVGSDRFC